jgi:hypothetical protein
MSCPSKLDYDSLEISNNLLVAVGKVEKCPTVRNSELKVFLDLTTLL